MYRYILHEAVKVDYDEAYGYYEEKLEGLGERFLSAVRAKLAEIVKALRHLENVQRKVTGKHRLILFPIPLFIKFTKRKE